MDSHHTPAGFQFKNRTYSINCLCLSSVSLSLLLAIYRLLHCRCPRVLQFWGSCRRHPGQKFLSVWGRAAFRQWSAGQDRLSMSRFSTAAGQQLSIALQQRWNLPPNEQIQTHCSRGCFCGQIVSGVSLKSSAASYCLQCTSSNISEKNVTSENKTLQKGSCSGDSDRNMPF